MLTSSTAYTYAGEPGILERKTEDTESQSIKLLQITDTHLFSTSDGCLLSVNTLDSFHAIIEEINNQQIPFDGIIATGDISQDHSERSYQRFEQGIASLEKPCYWLPGNHDYKPGMQSVLPSPQIQTNTHVLLGEHWQMILLDSQVEGVPHGKLSEEQLTYLDDKLAEYSNRHTLVLLHHHSVLVGSSWLDQHTLYEPEKFWQIIEKHNNVSAVLCGHVHQEYDSMHAGVRVMASPSTCVQFKPDSTDFALDPLSPGWRTLELLKDGSVATQVYRLGDGRFHPDFSASGY
ncbi:3',5'-cyclic-AMP phosphodiesterase [Vibrio albus]|jgi:Icc protein|uniref:3',5'-cyclic adenosine monophosphate phosphodiesterase CpdA n=1 Tax=Vibrio albus TaxID=2200953 RepID=A0A2U3B5B2_9VIBR|nr:3',5'-cyclic-AMP phosphodiesterase [Vibrio albus]